MMNFCFVVEPITNLHHRQPQQNENRGNRNSADTHGLRMDKTLPMYISASENDLPYRYIYIENGDLCTSSMRSNLLKGPSTLVMHITGARKADVNAGPEVFRGCLTSNCCSNTVTSFCFKIFKSKCYSTSTTLSTRHWICWDYSAKDASRRHSSSSEDYAPTNTRRLNRLLLGFMSFLYQILLSQGFISSVSTCT
jgi:hypothetical protein